MEDNLLEQYTIIKNLTKIDKKSNKLDQVCFRLIRGKTEDEFKQLAYPQGKKLAWVSSSKQLFDLLHIDNLNLEKVISNLSGKPLPWVIGKKKDAINGSWLLYLSNIVLQLIGMESLHCFSNITLKYRR